MCVFSSLSDCMFVFLIRFTGARLVHRVIVFLLVSLLLLLKLTGDFVCI